MKRGAVLSILAVAVLLAVGVMAEAQPAKKIPRIGYLSGFGDPKSPGPQIEAFRQGLRDLGYIEGKNVVIEFRYVEGNADRVPSLVTEFLQLKVDVLVIPHTGAIFAAKQAIKTIPLVIVTNIDPVATGVVDSLARPGGNITGLARLSRELGGKRLELLKEVVPKASRFAVLWDGDDDSSAIGLKQYEEAARGMKLQLQPLEVLDLTPDFDSQFRTAEKGRAQALVVIRNPKMRNFTTQIVALAVKHRLPCMWEGSDSVEAGGLMAYSTSDTDSFRRAATYVDKILKGTKPADLPVEQPMKFEFVINLKTAKQIGLAIPQSVLYRADRVIK